MSLINDMLRDLDARGERSPLASARVTGITPRRNARIGIMALAVTLALAMLITALMMKRPAPTPEPEQHAAPISLETVTDPVNLTQAEANVPLDSSAATSSAESTPASIPVTPPATAEYAVATLPPTASLAPTMASIPQRLSITAHAGGEREPAIARRLQAVAEALTAGNTAQAEQGLQEVLAQEPTHARARQSLASLHLRQNQPERAIAVWQEGLRLVPKQAQWAQSLARLHLQHNDAMAAATLLASATPALDSDTAYHALLGYAWQQAKQPTKAGGVYRALVDFDPTQGAWWLGLALAEEARGEHSQALHAFTQARNSGDLEISVLRYVDQRILALQANPSDTSQP